MIDISPFFNISFDMSWVTTLALFWQYSIRSVIVIVNVILVVLILYLLIRIWPRQHRITLFHFKSKSVFGGKKPLDRRFIHQWQNTIKRLSKPTSENLRLAVIDADGLVDVFLKKAGYKGEHMADRLSGIVPDEVKSLKRVWDAHLLRNSLVHVPGSKPSMVETKKAVAAFEDFLKELGALPEN